MNGKRSVTNTRSSSCRQGSLNSPTRGISVLVVSNPECQGDSARPPQPGLPATKGELRYENKNTGAGCHAGDRGARETEGVPIYYRASEVLTWCESESVEQNYCMTYLTGTLDTLNTLVSADGLRTEVCITKGVGTVQLQKIYIKHANEHPEVLHSAASAVAINAFRQAFPCE